MGSLRPNSPPPENVASNYRIYLSFCPKDPLQMSNLIECYDPRTNSFHKVTTIPGLEQNYAMKDFAMIALGDSIYVIGGRLCHKEFDTPDMSYYEVVSSVLRYNVVTDTWSKCADLITPRINFACTVHENKIFIAGGQTTFHSVKGTSSAEFYDPALNEWKSLPNMSTLRYKCVAVSWRGKIHVVGGFAEKENTSNDPQQGQIFAMERSSAEVFDTENNKWDLDARMWELDIPPNQIVPIGDKLYSSGDCYKAWKGHIEVYDAKLKIWSDVDGSNFDYLLSPSNSCEASDDDDENSGRLVYLTMAPIGNYLCFLAGYNMPGAASGMRSEVHVFNTSSNENQWRSLEPIYDEGSEKLLCCHCCVLQQAS
ncbi:hypothetical protein LIER_30251 [Lithospermum erythrorhizon]|uniref:Uncharacterized protein n=1 Tax=Lithospermum erythrorhizon TaxID=34254 RepID=A0AAV3RSW0_LITER